MDLFYTIPAMTNSLGRYWNQPRAEDILIDDAYAAMSNETFKKLREYSCTIPSGVYEGKMWKAYYSGEWYLRWYDVSENPERCSIRERLIVIV